MKKICPSLIQSPSNSEIAVDFVCSVVREDATINGVDYIIPFIYFLYGVVINVYHNYLLME